MVEFHVEYALAATLTERNKGVGWWSSSAVRVKYVDTLTSGGGVTGLLDMHVSAATDHFDLHALDLMQESAAGNEYKRESASAGGEEYECQ